MFKRICVILLGLIVLLIALPPLWYTLSPPVPPELPAPGQRVTLDAGVAVNVVERGAGPPVVLVHGLPGSAYDWRVLLDALAARGYRAIAYDRVGYGHSDLRPPGALHTVSANAHELNELLDRLALENVTLVGWSYGGATSMQAVVDGTNRVDRLVLVGTGGPDSAEAVPPDPPGIVRFIYSDPVLAWRSRVPPVGNALIRALSGAAYNDQPQPDWWIPGVQANFARPGTIQTYRGEIFDLAADDLLDPAGIDVPTLLLHGDEDRLAPLAISEYLATVIPDSTLQVTEGGSHMLPVTHADAVADAIVAFVGATAPDSEGAAVPD